MHNNTSYLSASLGHILLWLLANCPSTLGEQGWGRYLLVWKWHRHRHPPRRMTTISCYGFLASKRGENKSLHQNQEQRSPCRGLECRRLHRKRNAAKLRPSSSERNEFDSECLLVVGDATFAVIPLLMHINAVGSLCHQHSAHRKRAEMETTDHGMFHQQRRNANRTNYDLYFKGFSIDAMSLSKLIAFHNYSPLIK